MIHSARSTEKPTERTAEKVSFGIACFKIIDGQLRLLLVCKRYTYAFSTFVNGFYCSSDNNAIIRLLNKMTVDEKLDVLSLDFKRLWYRLYLVNGSTNKRYLTLKHKFETTFVIDSGSRVKRLVSASTHVSDLWEIPKGKKLYKQEKDLLCAMREFYEETNIDKTRYTLLSGKCKSIVFEDAHVRYVFRYYVALADKDATPALNITEQSQIGEIREIRWMTLGEMVSSGCHATTVRYAKSAFSFVHRYLAT